METYKQNVPLSQFELDWTRDHTSAWSPFWHFFEDLDHFPKLSEDSPNIITRRFYECIIVFSEFFLRDSNISDSCRRPPKAIILTRRPQIYRNLRKGNKCLSDVLSLILYMTRKISAILRVFNTYIFLITEKKQFSLLHHCFYNRHYLIYLWRTLYWTKVIRQTWNGIMNIEQNWIRNNEKLRKKWME